MINSGMTCWADRLYQSPDETSCIYLFRNSQLNKMDTLIAPILIAPILYVYSI